MNRSAVRLRFPSHVEIRYPEELPRPGDVVSGSGSRWVVRSVEVTSGLVTCHLAACEDAPEVAGHAAPLAPAAQVGSAGPPVDPTGAAKSDRVPAG